jgi:hypothetical protein
MERRMVECSVVRMGMKKGSRLVDQKEHLTVVRLGNYSETTAAALLVER